MNVSVIVPVHGIPEDMLRACVESLRRQTLAELEVLFVVDGAEDPGRPVLEEAARQDPRLVVLCNDRNQGVSASRNRGLEAARGKWFGFVDADDRIEPDMYRVLLALAHERECDLVGCGFAREAEDGIVRLDCPAGGVWDMASDFDAARAYENARSSCCNKLFRKDRFGPLRFDPELTNLEDALFLAEALGRATRVGFLPDPLYRVCYRPDSAHRRRIGLEQMDRRYRALSRLAEQGAERSADTKWMRRLWAWRLLSWSVAARRYQDELPTESQAPALEKIHRFYAEDLKPFHGIYPAWLRWMLEGRLKDEDRFFGKPGWFYTLLWQRIRIGLAPFEGRGWWELAMDSLRRITGRRRP